MFFNVAIDLNLDYVGKKMTGQKIQKNSYCVQVEIGWS